MNKNIEVKNLVGTKHGYVNCEINHETYGWIPFTATPNDVEVFGRWLFEAIKNGKYGDTAPYVEYVPTLEENSRLKRRERDSLLSAVDTLSTHPLRWAEISAANKDELKVYRLELLDVPQQAEFPDNVTWPSKPEILIN